MGHIRIGNSGWSYKDWVGTFYPKGCGSNRFLSEYFQHFDTVEINSTFYRIPSRSTVFGWAKEASKVEGREFCVKVPQEISHHLAMRESELEMMDAYSDFSRMVLEPLSENGCLGVVLFQSSPYFSVRGDIKYRMKSEPKVPLPEYTIGMGRLKDICKLMLDHPGEAAFEFRNSSWLNDDSDLVQDARDVLRAHGTALVTVDGPSFPWIYAETSRHNYIRFHGRNREGWYKRFEDDPSARYRYRYDDEELRSRVDQIKIISSKVDMDTRIFFNNHPQGYAPQNASKMMQLLGVTRPIGTMDRFW